MNRVETFRGFMSLWLILLFCGFSSWSYGKFVPEEIGKKLVALSKVVNYIHQRPYQMNADATFAITIVEANVAATLLHENARQLEGKHRNMLVSILHLCDSTRRQLLKSIIPENKDIRLLHETLNDPILWMRKISWRDNVLGKSVKTKLSNRDVRNLIMQGTPQEKESDQCLVGIVRNRLNWNHNIPDLCLEILTSREITRGYPLTHRLLIVLVAKAMQHNNTLPMKELIVFYCSAILKDLVDIESAGFPYQTADLMMEQVVLCGMEGFLEFTRSHYERLILRWARPSGCFSSFGNKSDESQARIFRRASKQTDFGCDSHATGVAAAALSLFIRENLETAYGYE